MAAISGFASIVAVLQLTSAVTKLCYDYISAVKDASKDIKDIINDSRNLESILLQLQDLETTPDTTDTVSIMGTLKGPDGPLNRCFVQLNNLADVLRSSLASKSVAESGVRRVGEAMMWPLKQKRVLRSLEVIRREKETLNLALTGDTTAVVRSMKVGVDSLCAEGIAEQRQRILQWLMVTDVPSYHRAARRKREPATGNWFLDGKVFQDWKDGKSSFVWLHGIPGCGKSILCSSIVKATGKYCAGRSDHAMAYYYFDFNDCGSGQNEHLLSTLIAQLCSRMARVPAAVERLYDHHCNSTSQPTTEELLNTLRKITNENLRAFLILDALDECTKREEILNLLKEIAAWKGGRVSILATSRRERDIELAIGYAVSNTTCLQTSDVGPDIRKFVRGAVSNDLKLKEWPEEAKKEIETSLVDGADGMFRWAVCQLEALRSCLTRAALKKSLTTLPKTLPETYDRILTSIDEGHREAALGVLQWLTYAQRPLTLYEVADVLAVKIGIFSIDSDDRLLDPREILTICSSLVTVSHSKDLGEIVRLAHYSVKEYLTSDRKRSGPASYCSLSETPANVTIAETCLTYLLSFKDLNYGPEDSPEEFPLGCYANKYWGAHTQRASEVSDRVHL